VLSDHDLRRLGPGHDDRHPDELGPEPPSGPGSTSRVQLAPLGVAVNSQSSANPWPLASALKSPCLTTDCPLAAPTGSPKLSNSGVGSDTPRLPSSRLAAKGVRAKVRRRLRYSMPWLKYSGPWLKYHDARPASKFTFSKGDQGASVGTPCCRRGGYYKYSPLVIGSEVSITTCDVLIASALAQPDARPPTAAAHLCDFCSSTLPRIGLAWKYLQLDKGGAVRGVGLLAVSGNNQAAQNQ